MRPALSPSLNRMMPTAPAAWAFASFWVNEQVPRWTSDTAPLVAAGKSEASQPLVLLLAAGLGMTMSFVGTTGALGTSLVGENSKAMKSTAALSSSAALPGTYVLSVGAICSSTGGAVSFQSGMLNCDIDTFQPAFCIVSRTYATDAS